MKRLIITTLIVVPMALANCVQASTWVGGVGNWSDPCNWSDGEPDCGVGANIDNGGTAQITQSDERSGNFRIGSGWGYSGTVEMSAGDLHVCGNLDVGYYGTGRFTQGGGDTVVDGQLFVGVYNILHHSADGRYSLSGGDLSATDEYFGSSAHGEFIQTGGTNTVTNNLILVGPGSASGVGSAVYSQTGGITTVGDDLVVADYHSNSWARYEIAAGTLHAGNLIVGNEASGTFTVTGDDPCIHLTGSYNQNWQSTLRSEVDSGGMSTINVSGTATVNGTWIVADLEARLGRFDILQADGGLTGSFATIILPEPVGEEYWAWGIDNGTTLWVEHIPEPTMLSLLALGGLALLRKCRA